CGRPQRPGGRAADARFHRARTAPRPPFGVGTMIIARREVPIAARRAAAIGAAGLVLAAFGALTNVDAFLRAWLVSWLCLTGIALAAMMHVMIHELTGGNWGLILRPPL